MADTSSMDCLPDDVLSMIFEEIMAEAEESLLQIPVPRNTKPDLLHKSLTVGLSALNLVCKRWRTVALSSPRIWTTIVSPFGNRRLRRHPVNLLLQRSGHCCLTIYDTGMTSLDHIFGKLAQYNAFMRVTRLHFVTGTDHGSRFASLEPHTFPNLQHLQLGTRNDHGTSQSLQPALGFLRRHPTIRTLKIDEHYIPSVSGRVVDAVLLPQLRLLRITHGSEQMVESFMMHLEAPNLAELQLKLLVWDIIPSVLETGRFPIRTLVLGGEIAPEHMRRLPTFFPEVEQLDLINPWMSRGWMQADHRWTQADMIRLLAPESIFPRLRTLSLYAMQMPADVLQGFIDRRLQVEGVGYGSLRLERCLTLEDEVIGEKNLDLRGVKVERWDPPFDW